MKKVFLFFFAMLLFLMYLQADSDNDQKKVRILIKEKKYTQALDLIDQNIKNKGINYALAKMKLQALKKLNHLDEANNFLAKALRNSSLAKYHRSIAFAKCGLNVERKDFKKALKDLAQLAELGFNDYGFFNQDKYISLRKLKGFKTIVDKMKQNGGIGKPAKDFTLTLLNGDKFTLSKLKDKVVLIDFWSTHCNPCLKELPQMKQYYSEFHPRGLEIVGISLDHQRDRLDRFLQKLKLPWGISFNAAGWNRKIVGRYTIFSIPSYWLVDRKGILRYFGLRKEELKSAIQELVEER